MYPTENRIFLPNNVVDTRPMTIEEVRENGRIVAISEDETRATVEVKIGLTVCYCGVLLGPGRTITDFIPRPINKYVQVSPAPSQNTRQYDPPEPPTSG